MAGQPTLADRYGSRARARPRRWLIYALGLICGLAVAVIGYENLGTKPVEAERTAFTARDDHSATMTIEVRRDDPHRPVTCVVIARSSSGDEVGRRDVPVPPAAGTATAQTTLVTSARAASGEVSDCSYNAPASPPASSRPTG